MADRAEVASVQERAQAPDRPTLGAGTWLAWCVTRLMGLLALHSVWPYHTHPLVGADVLYIYAPWAHALWHGLLPYQSIPILYPPGVLPLLILPAASAAVYQSAFYLVAFAVDAITFRQLGASGYRRGALVWLVAPVLLGPVFWARFDLFMAAALVGAVVAMSKGRYGWAGAWLALAALVKVWPAALILLFLVFVPRQRWVRYLGSALATVAVAVVPLLALGAGQGMVDMLKLQTSRGLEVEAAMALPLHVARLFGAVVPVRLLESTDYVGAGAHLLADLGTVLLVLALIGLGAWVWSRRHRGIGPAEVMLATVLVLLVFTKVLSAQYLVWVVVACALVVDRARRPAALLVALGGALVLTQVLYPFQFFGLVIGSRAALVVAVAHGLAVVVLALAGIRTVRQLGARAAPAVVVEPVPCIGPMAVSAMVP